MAISSSRYVGQNSIIVISIDEIAEYLSDTYGLIVTSFSVPMTDDDRDYFGGHVSEVEAQVG